MNISKFSKTVWLYCIFAVLSTLSAFSAQSGLFTYRLINGGTEIEITDYPTDATGTVNVPASIEGKPVTSIGNYAFEACSSITGVTLPNSVLSLGEGAFMQCSNLTSFPFPSSLLSIGNWAFEECAKFTNIILPENLVSLGDWAFEECGHTSINIPQRVTTIGFRAFTDAAYLARIDVDPNNTTWSSIDGVWFDKAQQTLICYPPKKEGASYTVPNNVTTIQEDAFAGNDNLTSITLPNSLINIEDEAFRGCQGLTSITIPSNVATMGDFIFEDCNNLNVVSFLGDAPTIGDYTFSTLSSEFYIEYQSGSTGFTSPTWHGIPTSIAGATLSLSDTAEDFEVLAGTHSFSVASNTSWSWSSNVNWITSSETTTQTGNQTFTYSVDENIYSEIRSGIITFKLGGLTATHIISQEAYTPPSETKLVHPEPQSGAWFGASTAVNGDITIMGTKYHDNQKGAVFVYNTYNGNFIEKLSPSSLEEGDKFGHLLAINSKYIAISAFDDDDPIMGTSLGSVYVYERATMSLLHKIVPKDGETGDHFGSDVDVAGNYLLVGSSDSDDHGNKSGSAYIYDIKSGLLLSKLTASDASEGALFGYKVGMNSRYAVIGAQHNKLGTSSSKGSVYIFDLKTGEEVRKITSANFSTTSRFGLSVEVSGNYALIGTYSSKFEVIEISSGKSLWTISSPKPLSGEVFGQRMALDGNYALLGNQYGKAYLYDIFSGEFLRQISISDYTSSSSLGFRFSLHDGYASIGSFRDDKNGTDSGAAYIFDLRDLAAVHPIQTISSTHSANHISTTWQPLDERWYAVYSSPNLKDWVQVDGEPIIVGDGDPITSDFPITGKGPQLFYRIQEIPQIILGDD